MRRLMIARTIKKIQVPAYAPVVVGVHCEEYKGVLWSVVKTIAALPLELDIPIPDMSILSVVLW